MINLHFDLFNIKSCSLPLINLENKRQNNFVSQFDWSHLPSDYVSSLIALLQSIFHAFLLHGNLRGSLASQRVQKSAQNYSSSSTSTSYLLPAAIRRRLGKDSKSIPNSWVGLSSQIASLVDIVEVLNHYDAYKFLADNPNLNQTNLSQTSHIVPSPTLVNDGLIGSNLNPNVEWNMEMAGSTKSFPNSLTAESATFEPSIILNPALVGNNNDEIVESKEAQFVGTTAIFLNRLKVGFYLI